MSLLHLSKISFNCKTLCLPLVVTLLLQFTPYLCAAQEGAVQQSQDTSSERFITIDFDNVDIRLFIKYISELTGKNFVVDKAVQGNVTIISPTKISEKEAYQLFESVLEVNGFTTVSAGAISKIMPASRALSQNINTLSHGGPSRPEDKIVTQIIPLSYTTPDEMKKVLAPLVSKTSVVIAHTQSGMLIITETLSNIQKLLTIIEAIDVPLTDEEIAVIPLNYASSTVAATAINTIFQQTPSPNKGAKSLSSIKVVAYEPINCIILVASPTDITRIKHLITLLDTEMKQSEGNIQVVYLQHATAKELATVLTSLPGQQSTDPAKKGEAPTISKDVKIMPDTETNSLIITASRSEFRELENVIKKLDIPRRMVYLEALIMEVDADATFDVGVNWMAGGVFADGTGQTLAGFGGSAGYKLSDTIGYTPAVPAVAATATTAAVAAIPATAAIGQGFSLGVLKQGIKIGGITFPDIGAVLRAYKTDSNVNVIATPQILTTDNKKAEISIGENTPYLTRTQAAIDSTGTTTDTGSIGYQNYEYKDIATKLTITPQINQADILRLEIATEVSKLKAGSAADKPTTFKRTATTTVLVKDNNTIVIGGIIGQDDTEGEYKIPLLGDIPLLGWLFKEKNTSRKKTNMFIFITPRIIKNPGDMAGVTALKTDTIEKDLPEAKQLLVNPTDKSHVMSMVDRGFEQMQKGKYEEAKEQFNQALSIDPYNPYAQFNLATINEREGNPQQAIKQYQMILDNNSKQAALVNSRNPMVDNALFETCKENIKRLQKTQPPPMEPTNQN
ncbi:MAG: type II secretion system secretin GspD [Proteobacteria bacterium]|nr:type II secretion system secretin GspD [Pseudomonadota bacterium]MBU1650270.1 type II secretion system secretin GspD [Pseudomonadota bacterium]